MTPEEAASINNQENARVGRQVQDVHGVVYWITDICADDRLRVVAGDGSAWIFDPETRVATKIKEPRKQVRR